jgi:hypothetical protein
VNNSSGCIPVYLEKREKRPIHYCVNSFAFLFVKV